MATNDPATVAAADDNVSPVGDMEKQGHQTSGPHEVDENLPESETDSAFKQDGVRQIEAITSVWSLKMLWLTFALLWLVTFIDSLMVTLNSNLSRYITSAFNEHGLLSVVNVVATLIGGVIKLPLAKVLDIWGRVQGFCIMVLLMVIGAILKATCNNLETAAAAQTFYWVGHIGFTYIIDVVLADMSSLRNRSIILGINGLSAIITTFAGAKLAEVYEEQTGWRWAFGSMIIVLVFFCIPVVAVLLATEIKAKKMGVFPKRDASGRSTWESIVHYFVQFDVVGMLFTTGGFALITIPLSIASYAPEGWATPYIIAMIVTGVVCLGIFAGWERFFATISYLPFRYLKNRTILGAACCYGTMFLSIYCWDLYYSSYLQVVNNQGIAATGYINNTMTLVSAFLYPAAGLMYRYFGTFKWQCIGVATPFMILGTALLIYFRHPGTGVNWLVMCQVFLGIGTCALSSGAYIAAMAAVSHNEIAVVLAILGLFGSIGAAIGESVSGAIWGNIFPVVLQANLPPETADQWRAIYGSIDVQLSYPIGSPTRDAIIVAYGEAQRKMVIAGTAFVPVILLTMLVWENLDLKKLDNVDNENEGKTQTKGTVF